MRKLLVLVIAALFIPALGNAAPLKFHGTLVIELGTLPTMTVQGSGIATVNNSTGYGHLNNIFLNGGISGATQVPVTDPETTVDGIISVRITVEDAVFGSWGNISGGGPLNPNQGVSFGIAKICLYDPNCLPGGFISVPLFEHKAGSTTIGAGVGGLQTIGGAGMIRISILNNTWSIGMVSAIDQTDNGAFVVEKRTGFAHGPASLTSTTAKPSGVVQFVTPIQISTNLTVGSNDLIATFQILRLHFIPEPGVLLLLGSGVAGLVLIGRQRMKRK